MNELNDFIKEYLNNFDCDNIKEIKHKIKGANFDNVELNMIQKKIFEIADSELFKTNGLLVLNRIEKILNIINNKRLKKTKKDIVCFTPGSNCINPILEFLDSAKKNISICVFTISDDRISKKLIACKKKGISIKIITDNDKQYDRGSDINWLVDEGLEVKIDLTRHHMHHKFAIVDNKKLLTGSYNWTRSASKYNHENFIISSNKKTVAKFQKEFNKLWELMIPHQ